MIYMYLHTVYIYICICVFSVVEWDIMGLGHGYLDDIAYGS